MGDCLGRVAKKLVTLCTAVRRALKIAEAALPLGAPKVVSRRRA